MKTRGKNQAYCYIKHRQTLIIRYISNILHHIQQKVIKNILGKSDTGKTNPLTRSQTMRDALKHIQTHSY